MLARRSSRAAKVCLAEEEEALVIIGRICGCEDESFMGYVGHERQ